MTWRSAARHRAKVGALILALGAAFPLGVA